MVLIFNKVQSAYGVLETSAVLSLLLRKEIVLHESRILLGRPPPVAARQSIQFEQKHTLLPKDSFQIPGASAEEIEVSGPLV